MNLGSQTSFTACSCNWVFCAQTVRPQLPVRLLNLQQLLEHLEVREVVFGLPTTRILPQQAQRINKTLTNPVSGYLAWINKSYRRLTPSS